MVFLLLSVTLIIVYIIVGDRHACPIIYTHNPTIKNMSDLEQIKHEIKNIKARNKRVETDKAWETSFLRKIIILILTYIVIAIFFYCAKIDKPFISAIVPALAFVLSTLSIPVFKKVWLRYFYR